MTFIEQYRAFLEHHRFNEKQIELIEKVKVDFELIDKESDEAFIEVDTWERAQWYTFNRSGLFERDEENQSGIFDWAQAHTRMYITEYEYQFELWEELAIRGV